MSRRKGRRRNRLTDRFVRIVGKPGKYSDGNGLFLQVYESGAKCWQQRYMINGRTRTPGLGGYPTVSLKKARKKALKNLVKVSDGVDPLDEKHKKKAPTFAEACAIVVEIKRVRWSNPREAHDWLRTFENYAYPYFGDKPVSEVEPGDVLESLLPIWTEKPTTAKKLRSRTGAVMKWAVTKGYRTTNPAGDVLDGGLPGRVKTDNFPAVPYADLSRVVSAVHSSDARPTLTYACEFLVLTAARTSEVLGARWREFDFKTNTWTVPAKRMKMRKEHQVPLSCRALAVLEKAREFGNCQPDDPVFPSPTGRLYDKNSIARVFRELKVNVVPHGCRSSFRDWCADTGVAQEVAEACIAHAPRGVEGNYKRTVMLERRRPTMEAWAEYLADTAPSDKER